MLTFFFFSFWVLLYFFGDLFSFSPLFLGLAEYLSLQLFIQQPFCRGLPVAQPLLGASSPAAQLRL